MKLLFLFTALILSATAYAEEANDTTFNVKDKKIVVDVQDSKTIVKVYDNNGFLHRESTYKKCLREE